MGDIILWIKKSMKKQDRNLRQEEMTHHIQSWKESGQSQKQYCLSNNL